MSILRALICFEIQNIRTRPLRRVFISFCERFPLVETTYISRYDVSPSTSAMESAVNDVVSPKKQRVGLLLGVLICFFPLIFYWFLFRKGYSARSRVLGFIWMALPATLIAVLVLNAGPPRSAGAQSSATKPAPSEAATARSGVPGDAIDKITLLYINHDVYPSSSIICKSKLIGGRGMVGCRANKVGQQSNIHIWMYSRGTFWSVNGSARSLA